ncbi:MAG: DUF370 domain-containing protein [Ruminococcaceae bacterium]|nr:DUF370 domain-containing protein [Oscillospiraceae bacterium]
MFLHLGGDVVVRMSDVVAVFDMDNTTVSKHSRNFLTKAQRAGEVVDVTEDLPKSYIITNSGGKTRVYISSISSQTLTKRAKSRKITETYM